MTNLKVNNDDSGTSCTFAVQYADVEESRSVLRHGAMGSTDSIETLGNDLPKLLEQLSTSIGNEATTAGGEPINVLHVNMREGTFEGIGEIEKILAANEKQMKLLGIRTVNLLIPNKKKDPSYYTFTECTGYKEDPLRRNMRPTFHHLLELGRLSNNFELERLPAIGKNVQVYIGVDKNAKQARGAPSQVVFARGISHSRGVATDAGAQRALQMGLDELERALANSKVNSQSSSRIFLHSLREFEGVTVEEMAGSFKKLMGRLKSRLAPRLLKLRVDEIEVKIRIAGTGDDGQPKTQNVRLVASSMEGVWLKPVAYLETPDPVTGLAMSFCEIDEDGIKEECLLEDYGATNVVQTKRSIARRVGSTYAYDFLGLLEVGLFGEWEQYISSLPSKSVAEISFNLFEF
jgi:acetyl-CoA carboxylase/biotin carboxylase 1